MISRRASFKNRLMIANSVCMSTLVYVIQLWGGTTKSLLRAPQVTQNRIMKTVTGKSWFTPAGVLLRECNWLSVHQLVYYHTILSVHKVVLSESPSYLYNKMCSAHGYETRNNVKFGEMFASKTARASSSFCYRGATSYNFTTKP